MTLISCGNEPGRTAAPILVFLVDEARAVAVGIVACAESVLDAPLAWEPSFLWSSLGTSLIIPSVLDPKAKGSFHYKLDKVS